MHAEDLLVYESAHGQAVEAVGEGFPESDVVTSLAFIVKSIYAVDGCAFVVPAEEKEVFWVFDFVGEKEADGLEGLLAAIDVITEEEIIGFWWEASVFEESEEIGVLSVNIAWKEGKGGGMSVG